MIRETDKRQLQAQSQSRSTSKSGISLLGAFLVVLQLLMDIMLTTRGPFGRTAGLHNALVDTGALKRNPIEVEVINNICSSKEQVFTWKRFFLKKFKHYPYWFKTCFFSKKFKRYPYLFTSWVTTHSEQCEGLKKLTFYDVSL